MSPASTRSSAANRSAYLKKPNGFFLFWGGGGWGAAAPQRYRGYCGVCLGQSRDGSKAHSPRMILSVLLASRRADTKPATVQRRTIPQIVVPYGVIERTAAVPHTRLFFYGVRPVACV